MRNYIESEVSKTLRLLQLVAGDDEIASAVEQIADRVLRGPARRAQDPIGWERRECG
jgi:hypothetical protein